MPFFGKLICLSAGVSLAISAVGQSLRDASIPLANPSFEGAPTAGSILNSGWYDCGKPGETPPDIQPGFFEVKIAANHGLTYLGLVVRDNHTWEAVGQRLARPLEQNKCYGLNVDLCRALEYVSISKSTNQKVNFTVPVKLRIWGGNNYCEKKEMLYETALVTSARWLTQSCRLSPQKASYTHLILEAYYNTPILFTYNGNLLIDNLSAIYPMPCDPKPTDALAVKAPGPMVVKPKIKPLTPTVTTARATAPPARTDTAKKPPVPTIAPDITTTAALKREKLTTGKIIPLPNVYFDVNKFALKSESLPTLNEVFNFLSKNQDVVIEIGGHTNNLPSDVYAETLSTNRAKAVAQWLIDKGIVAARIQHRGYGKKMPIETNATPEGRRKNQRVEIKILSING
jgi:outer membrane protein OmpA-like peptidoglycan-associated protein